MPGGAPSSLAPHAVRGTSPTPPVCTNGAVDASNCVGALLKLPTCSGNGWQGASVPLACLRHSPSRVGRETNTSEAAAWAELKAATLALSEAQTPPRKPKRPRERSSVSTLPQEVNNHASVTGHQKMTSPFRYKCSFGLAPTRPLDRACFATRRCGGCTTSLLSPRGVLRSSLSA